MGENTIKEKKVIGPVLGWLVFTLTGLIAYMGLGSVIGGIIGIQLGVPWLSTLFAIIASLIYLIVYTVANKATFNGCFKSDDMSIGFLLLIPYLFVAILSTILTIVIDGHHIGLTWTAVLTSVYAAVCEEITIRAIPAAHMMRCYDDEKKIPLVCILTAVAFGLIHAGNLFSGSDVGFTILQIIQCFAVGMLLCASYLRTGSILPAMIGHFLNDVIAFMDTDMYSSSGLMSDGTMISTRDIVINLIGAAVYIIVALYAIRPAKRGEIMAIWAKKWKKQNT